MSCINGTLSNHQLTESVGGTEHSYVLPCCRSSDRPILPSEHRPMGDPCLSGVAAYS